MHRRANFVVRAYMCISHARVLCTATTNSPRERHSLTYVQRTRSPHRKATLRIYTSQVAAVCLPFAPPGCLHLYCTCCTHPSIARERQERHRHKQASSCHFAAAHVSTPFILAPAPVPDLWQVPGWPSCSLIPLAVRGLAAALIGRIRHGHPSTWFRCRGVPLVFPRQSGTTTAR